MENVKIAQSLKWKDFVSTERRMEAVILSYPHPFWINGTISKEVNSFILFQLKKILRMNKLEEIFDSTCSSPFIYIYACLYKAYRGKILFLFSIFFSLIFTTNISKTKGVLFLKRHWRSYNGRQINNQIIIYWTVNTVINRRILSILHY